ncbi:M23 family metallopeptidase [Plantactinospora sp. GCM10030261]|uniref:M23 family metallopeptidase n=1 Tax=Plantactinospora sp. GCM10030261 TaxID=3273420 RepID=UPI003610E651
MQEDLQNDQYHDTPSTETDTEQVVPGRHRRFSRRMSRRTGALLAIAALAVGGAGATVLTVADGTHDDTATAGLEDRAQAADRADRSRRDPVLSPSASPSASASASPSLSASPTASPTRKPAAKATTKAAKSWVHPMPGADVTSCYGPRGGVLHAGVDLAQPAGTPIRAAAAGSVVKAGDVGDGYGISVVIEHSNGYLTHYAHQSRLAVSVGDKVSAGKVIGYEGSTGDSTGPHLHFEVHKGQMWNQIDPAPYMRARGVSLGC